MFMHKKLLYDNHQKGCVESRNFIFLSTSSFSDEINPLTHTHMYALKNDSSEGNFFKRKTELFRVFFYSLLCASIRTKMYKLCLKTFLRWNEKCPTVTTQAPS